MTDDVETLIVGAGPTGLGAAWRLAQLGCEDWYLCEAEATAGGLASSVTDEHGFTWDLGGHVQFSHYACFDELMDELLGPGGWLYHERQSWVWIRNTFVPYPFQLNLHRLPAAERDECLRGLMQVTNNGCRKVAPNFGSWIDATLGAGIGSIFLRPYNLKVWAYPLEELSWSWVGDRVASVDLARVLDNIRHQRDDVSWGPNNRFRFPVRGGTGATWRALAERLGQSHPERLRMRHRLGRLDTSRRMAYFANERSIRYQRMLSTIPLDDLIRLSDLAPRLGPALTDLLYSSTHIIGVALRGQPGPHLEGKCWMYFPESDCPFYRVTVFSHYSPNNVPDFNRYWSLIAEVSESPVRPVHASSVVENTIQGMLATCLIPSRDAVHHVWHRRLEHGYPTPSLHRDRALEVILPALQARGVWSRGRFGAWKYEVSNQDHSFSQGVELVDHWLTGGLEETFCHPEMVNGRRSGDAAVR
ncbi:MAG: protoporphyrinogen/coproporphyrinogen oxidase [Candidatus Binatia bacterium]